MEIVGVIIVIIIIIKILYDREKTKKNDQDKIITKPFEKQNQVLPLNENKVIIHDIKDLEKKQLKNNENITQNSEVNNYNLPKIYEILDAVQPKSNNSKETIKNKKEYIEEIFALFNVPAKVVEVHIGPSVTQYEMALSSNVNFNRVINVENNIAQALSKEKVELQIPIPGKKTIGVEIPNEERNIVTLRETLESKENEVSTAKIAIPLGKNIIGETIITDLTKLQTILIAGAAGSGKSTFINNLISSILMQYKPNEVKLVLIDLKKVELNIYNGIPHLLCPVVNDSKKAFLTLQRVVKEMDNRFLLFSDAGVKDIEEYNKLIDKENENNIVYMKKHMSYIVVVIDELLDLLKNSSTIVEIFIQIAKLSRSTGVFLVAATQRTFNDTLSKEIIECFQTKISFRVSNKVNSNLILGQSGGEKLLDNGDMLFLDVNKIDPIRIQACFINEAEIKRLVDYCKRQLTVIYNDNFVNLTKEGPTYGKNESNYDTEDDYNKVLEFAIQTGKISPSLIQRRFHYGYNRAANMMDLLEARGIVGPQNGSKPREVIVKLENIDKGE